MADFAASLLDRLALFFGVPPWIVILTLIFLVALVAGMGHVVRGQTGGAPDWKRDPESMHDLSPNLRRARLQMIGAAIAMIFVGIIAVLNLIQ